MVGWWCGLEVYVALWQQACGGSALHSLSSQSQSGERAGRGWWQVNTMVDGRGLEPEN